MLMCFDKEYFENTEGSGILDRLVGGVVLWRGRRHPTDIGVGDALDFWRVLEVDQPDRPTVYFW